MAQSPTARSSDSAAPYPFSAPASEAGWKLAFSDDFNGITLNSAAWGTYNAGERKPEAVSVHNGMLTISTQRQGSTWISGGVSNRTQYAATYGKYQIRARFDKGAGVRAVALLWPSAAVWPPEVDFFEIGGSDPLRVRNVVTNVYTPLPGEPSAPLRPGIGMQHASYAADFTRWHVIGVEWSPTSLKYTLDGIVVATMTGTHIPNIPMRICLQTHTGLAASARPTAQTPSKVNFDIDWVALYTAS